jgi:hypothetical protein
LFSTLKIHLILAHICLFRCNLCPFDEKIYTLASQNGKSDPPWNLPNEKVPP